jgi:hypothetical protein
MLEDQSHHFCRLHSAKTLPRAATYSQLDSISRPDTDIDRAWPSGLSGRVTLFLSTPAVRHVSIAIGRSDAHKGQHTRASCYLAANPRQGPNVWRWDLGIGRWLEVWGSVWIIPFFLRTG